MQKSTSSCRRRQFDRQAKCPAKLGRRRLLRVATPANTGSCDPGTRALPLRSTRARERGASRGSRARTPTRGASSPSAVQHAVPFCLVPVTPTTTRGRPSWWRFGLIREGWRWRRSGGGLRLDLSAGVGSVKKG
jgi:hypothetical protein